MSKTIEKYYAIGEDIKGSFSQLNYVLLNPILPYLAYSQCGQTALYTQPNSVLSGTLYNNRHVQQNIDTNTINITIEFTLSFDEGILVFTTSRNFEKQFEGFSTISKPTFQSGKYLGKDIEIIRTVFLNDNEIIEEYAIIY